MTKESPKTGKSTRPRSVRKLLSEKGDQFKSEIQEAYNEYIAKVSAADMAVSFETSVVLMALCDLRKPKSILDLGSGFSSYVFRYFRKEHFTDECVILSIDTNTPWIRKSAGFLQDRGYTTYNFKFWNDIKDTTDKFDLIFVDIDRTYPRISYYASVLENFVSKKSVVLFDDMHKGILAESLNEALSKYNYKSINIQDLTLDEFGRFSKLYSQITPKESDAGIKTEM